MPGRRKGVTPSSRPPVNTRLSVPDLAQELEHTTDRGEVAGAIPFQLWKLFSEPRARYLTCALEPFEGFDER